MPTRPNEGFASPFGEPAPSLSDAELRITAYEILVGACRSSGTKPLTFVSRSASEASSSSSLQRSMTSAAASKVKRALGLKKSRSSVKTSGDGGGDSVSEGRVKSGGELMRIQMKVSEQHDSRVRRALLRIAAAQLGRRMESMVLPLELLQQLKPSDFSNHQEFEVWQKRHLKVLEAGLLMHPHLPLDKKDKASHRLRQVIRGALEKPVETGINNESMQVLRTSVMSLACRTSDGSASETCHWADGFPFNLRLYQMLLEACFDVNDETSIIEEVDEALDSIKKTWVTLGIDQMLHNLCFLWVLFHRYVATGQVENDLLFAANNLLVDVAKDAKEASNPDYSNILSSILSSMFSWAEKRLFSYRNTFNSDNTELFEAVVSLAVVTAKILVEDISREYRRKRKGMGVSHKMVDAYIRSSVRTAFSQKMEKLNSSRRSSRTAKNSALVLTNLAQDSTILAFDEKGIFSPILKKWHSLPAGVAVATLHACYADELKIFVSGVSELTPDVIQVLRAADKLEKDLVQIAVEDAVDSEDGGKSIIQEMPPYEAETVISNLVKSWMRTRIDRLKEWVDKNLQQEAWNPKANKERLAPSAIEVLRMLDETIEAFFLLPIPTHSALFPDLATGLDKCLQHYIMKTKSGCGSRNTFVPTMPALTRCTVGSKFRMFKKEKSHTLQRRKSQLGASNGKRDVGVLQLFVRINTLQHIKEVLEVLENRAIKLIENSESNVDYSTNGRKMFEHSAAACAELIQHLCEAMAYKIVFHDLSHVLWDGLYVGEVQSSRIEPFLRELEPNLEIISSTVHDKVRTRAITHVMRASFYGFLLVLLAGGPSRAFTLQDSAMIEEDFKFLKNLFWSNGDGLPADLVDKFSTMVTSVITLFRMDTQSLIEQFKNLTMESYGSAAKSYLPLPPTTGQWSPTEPNTLLRILCYRNDEMATKFLKKAYDLPRRL